MKKILITGSEGMLGQALINCLSNKGFLVEGADIRSRYNGVDITSIDDLTNLISKIRPDTVIHAAAYTDVNGCELNPDKTYRINGEGTKNVAQACQGLNTFLIYISTDFVFDGTKATPYVEEDRPNPINVYGKSKLMGENFIREILTNYLIIRTSWLFGKGGENFVDTIISRVKTEKRLKVVDDQRGSPTYTVDLAEAIAGLLLRTANYKLRILNITNSGSCSRYEFAKAVLKIKGIEGVILEPVGSEKVSYPARRPRMSILDNSSFEKFYGRELPGWEDALQHYIKEKKVVPGTTFRRR